jgi:hypothetical protein
MFRRAVVQVKLTTAMMIAQPRATNVAILARAGFPAPSSSPTLVETDELRAWGNVYINDVVWIKIAVVATATCGLGKYPARSVMISYHHHSKHTPKQLGRARPSRGHHSCKQAEDHGTHVPLSTPEYHRYPNMKNTMLKLVHTAATATPGTPSLRTKTRRILRGTWRTTAAAEHQNMGAARPCDFK